MSYKILFRRGTDTEWSSSNPILTYGEVGCEMGASPQLKVGDGMTPWNDLPYAGSGIGVVPGGDAGAVLTKDSSTNYDTSWVSRVSLAEDESFSERFEYKVAIDVRDHGALFDGVTDDSTAIQAAITAAAVSGGIVRMPAGTAIISTAMILRTNVVIQGAGLNLTTIKLSPNANCAAFETEDFATLNAGNTIAGPHSFAVRDLTIDGNKIYNVTSYGLKIYGYGFELSRLRITECDNQGIYSKWSSELGEALPNDMMASITDVQVHNCLGDGIQWHGPHDSVFVNCYTYRNARGIVVETNGNGSTFFGCHSYGIGQQWGAYLNTTGCVLVGCTIEGGGLSSSDGGQVYIGANDVSIFGGQIYSAGVGTPANNVRGIVIGTASPISGTHIETKISNCAAGALVLTNDGGGYYSGLVYQTTGASVTGTLHVDSNLLMNVNGGATYIGSQINGGTFKVEKLFVPISNGGFAAMGTATLVAGKAQVFTGAITANSYIFVTPTNPGGTVGTLVAKNIGGTDRSAGNWFFVSSMTSAGAVQTLDTSTFNWLLIEGS